MVNFVPAVAYHFCLNLPAVFSQPGARLLLEPCIGSEGGRLRDYYTHDVPNPPPHSLTLTPTLHLAGQPACTQSVTHPEHDHMQQPPPRHRPFTRSLARSLPHSAGPSVCQPVTLWRIFEEQDRGGRAKGERGGGPNEVGGGRRGSPPTKHVWRREGRGRASYLCWGENWR